jgi:Holliday junction resolvasome RuvABC endonuclease subunit
MLATVTRIEAIYFEEVRRHLGVDAAHAYGGFLAHLSAWCEQREIAYEGVPVGTIKRHVTGKGNAGKAKVIQAVRQRGHHPADDNEADALALLHWVIDTRLGGAT